MMMKRTSALQLVLCAGLVAGTGLAAVPLQAQNLGDIVSGVAETMLQQERDKAAYAQAQRTNTADAYRSYLDSYPNGAYANQAQDAWRRLGGDRWQNNNNQWNNRPDYDRPDYNRPDVMTPAAREANIGMSRNQRAAIQRQLTALGYATGGADGVWGRNTRNALSRWQSANGYPASGYMTEEQFCILNRGGGSVGNNVQPVGNAASEEARLGLSRSEKRDVQIRLNRLGYSTGGADGVWGCNTRNAIANWQGDQGESATGYLTGQQWRVLQNQRRR